MITVIHHDLKYIFMSHKAALRFFKTDVLRKQNSTKFGKIFKKQKFWKQQQHRFQFIFVSF